MLLSLLGEVSQRYFSVRHIAQLVTHSKTVKIAKSVLFKKIARKDIIFKKQFRAPTIYRQVLIFVINFVDFSFPSYRYEFLKKSVQKILYIGTVIEIAVQ